jgi:dynein heavy chain
MFQKGKRHPPLLRNHPPISGAIFWSRRLLDNLKRSVLMYLQVEELQNSGLREEVSVKVHV